MIAGSATPTDARMMWNPSVNAIWLRARSRFDANVSIAVGLASGPQQSWETVVAKWLAAAHAGLGFGQPGLELLRAEAVDRGDGLSDGVDQRLVHGIAAVGVIDGDDPSRPSRQRGVHLLSDATRQPVLGELAHHAARGGSDRGRSQQRRREQPHGEPGASAELRALAAEVVAGLGHMHF